MPEWRCNPQSLNRYAYALNNPTTFTDPSGLCGGCKLAAVPYLGSQDEFDDIFNYTQGPEGQLYFLNAVSWTGDPPAPPGTGGGGGGLALPPASPVEKPRPPQPQAPAEMCTGFGRGLGNTGALAGNPGAIPGVTVGLGTAAVAPSQFGLADTGAALVPYAGNISGIMGAAPFSSVTDVIGGKSPISGMNARVALQRIYPGQLLIEIYGAADQGVNAPVSISVPAGLGCPTGTNPAVFEDPVPLPRGPAVDANAPRLR